MDKLSESEISPDLQTGWSKNELLAMHGPNRFLVVRLARYAAIGWIAFFLSLLLFAAYVAVDKLVPVPVIAVNDAGQVLGTFEYLDPTARSDAEVIAASKYFLDRFLSVNSATIYEDQAAALSMMSPDLMAEKIAAFKATNYLAQAQKARTHSYTEFDRNQGAVIVSRRASTRAVRLKGKLVVNGQEIDSIIKPFDLTLDLKIVPRNTLTTTGVLVISMRDN